MVKRGAPVLADVRIKVEAIIAKDDRVAVRWSFRRSYVGEAWDSFPKPGEEFNLAAISMYRFADRKIEDDRSIETFWQPDTPWDW